jgi:hypothetical protein
MELKDIESLVDKAVGGLDEKNKKAIGDVKDAIVKDIEAKGFQSKDEVASAIDVALKAAKDEFEKELIEVKKSALEAKVMTETKSLDEVIGEGLKEIKSDLANLKNRKTNSVTAMLTKADEDLDPANFENDSYAIATTDRSRGLWESPFAPVWFRNLLPQGTASGGTIQYLREKGNVGAAGVWDGTGAIDDLDPKPGTAPLFDSVTESVIWIAGITRVKREMLDDISWLRGYLARRLTVGRTGLYVAENTQIYNALLTNSVSYNGTKTIPIEMIYDAAFGQLRDNFYNPTTILMNSRDVVNLIALNKASTSGEYDLPPGTVIVVNGQLTIGGVPVIGAPNVPTGQAIVMDRNQTELIVRMNPEVRFFEEDRDNVPKNLVTVRVEERMLPIVHEVNAVIVVNFATT